MRIRKKKLGVSPIVFPVDSHFNPGQEVQTRYCQLNQSPWDVITDFSPPASPMAPPSPNLFQVEEENALAMKDPIPTPYVYLDLEEQTTDEYYKNDLTIEEVRPMKENLLTLCNKTAGGYQTVSSFVEEENPSAVKYPIPKRSVPLDPEEQTTDEYYNNDLTIEEVDQRLPNLHPMKETRNAQPRHELTAGLCPLTANADNAGFTKEKKNNTFIFKSTQQLVREFVKGLHLQKIENNRREAAASSSLLSSLSSYFHRFGGFGQRSARKRKAYEMCDGGKKPNHP